MSQRHLTCLCAAERAHPICGAPRAGTFWDGGRRVKQAISLTRATLTPALSLEGRGGIL